MQQQLKRAGATHASRNFDDKRAAAGFRVEGTFLNDDGSERMFYATDGRIRIESVAEALRPDYDRWLRADRAEAA